ncbi:MAG: NUDIX hydrolase [Alphaproteobacteria bacterium]|jgi:ADP-ribose pyrophosphatase|nr:NUDIX hydrolase [Alphaproteobacteria bacterium]
MNAQPLSTEGETDPWVRLAHRRAYEGPYLAVDEYDVLKPNGHPGYYGVVRFKRVGVGVLPIDEEGWVYLVGQWRFAIDAYSWEMPEGAADPGEDFAATALRELEEEAGLKAAWVTEALRMRMSNSVTDEECVVFIATGLETGAAAPDDTELFREARLPFQDALAAALDGRIVDALTIAALLRAHHMAVTGALPENLRRAMLREAGGVSGL